MHLTDYRGVGEKFEQRMALRRQVMDALGIKLPRKIDKEIYLELHYPASLIPTMDW